MKKIYSLVLALSLFIFYANAVEVSLWEGTCTEDGVELNATTVASLEIGDILRVYVTIPEGGANFKIVYKGAPDWSETTIPSIGSQYPWVNGGETYKDFALTSADLTAFEGKNIYLYNGENSAITKVSVLREDLEPGVEKTLWTGSETLSWNKVAPQSAITAALLGEKDQFIVSVSAKSTAEEEKWPKVCLVDNNTAIIAGTDIPLWDVTEFPYDGALTLTAAHVAALQGGFTLGGTGVTITKLVLKKFKGGTTAVDNTNADSKAVKLIRDGQVFILRDNKTYTLQGQLIK